ASIEDITEKIENVGCGVLKEKAEFDVVGMTCAACSTRIGNVLNKQEGVRHRAVILTTEKTSIEYNPDLTDIKAIIEKIKMWAMMRNRKQTQRKSKRIKKKNCSI